MLARLFLTIALVFAPLSAQAQQLYYGPPVWAQIFGWDVVPNAVNLFHFTPGAGSTPPQVSIDSPSTNMGGVWAARGSGPSACWTFGNGAGNHWQSCDDSSGNSNVNYLQFLSAQSGGYPRISSIGGSGWEIYANGTPRLRFLTASPFLGVGENASAPRSPLHVISETAGADFGLDFSSFEAHANPAYLYTRRAQGTAGGGLTQVTSGLAIGGIWSSARNNSSAWNFGATGIRWIADENQTSSAAGAHAEIMTTPTGSTTAERSGHFRDGGAGPGVGKTVAGLGTCNSTTVGLMKYVTDGAAALAWGATVTGGGSTIYLVWCNQTNWTVVAK